MKGIQSYPGNLTALSHDLRAPLNAIIGYSEMLSEVCFDRGWQVISNDLNRISQAGRALVEVINADFDSARVKQRMSAGRPAIIASGLDFQIRTSLNAIIGYTELALEEANDQGFAELISDLEKIHEAADLFLNQVRAISEPQIQTTEDQPQPEDETVTSPDPIVYWQKSQRYRDAARHTRDHQGNILVVDDDPLNRETLTQYLTRSGYLAVTAENGSQALEMVLRQRYDLILLDILMPVVDGFQVLAYLKNDESLRDIPVIIISSLDDQEHIVQGIRMGADDCLPKPFDPLLLGARVEACLEKKRWHNQEQEYLAIIEAERQKSEHLLLQMLPAPIAERLKAGETFIADSFEEVTILFADLVSFTPLAAQMKPKPLVILLNDIFCMFEGLARQYDLEKIHAVGDEFIVAAGLLKPGADRVSAVADFALAMLQALRGYNANHGYSLEIRIGIETGPIIAGVIGTTKFGYDLWGDAINTASRMQSHGLAGRIHLTENTFLRLKDQYDCEDRGVIQVKGKGDMRTYFLIAKKEPE
jgi:adenylate cyclase